MTRVSQVPQIGLKEERRVLLYASDGLKPKVRCLGKPLVKSREGGICALAVLTRIQAQRLVGLVHAQAAVEQHLDHRGDYQVEHQHDNDRHHNTQNLRDEQ